MKIRLIAIVTIALLAAPDGSGSDPETEAETPAKTEKQKAWEKEMEDFLPSEEVPADSAISFPVDI